MKRGNDMEKLVKVKHEMFNEYFEGERKGYIQKKGYVERKVICILNDNCVRYCVIENGKFKRKSYFDNDNKELCFRNAEKVLNRGFIY